MNVSTFFSNQARRPSGIFGSLIASRIFDKGNAELNDFMKDLLCLKKNDHVLEIGFGTGKLIHEMAEITHQGIIEGVDFSSVMVSEARKKNKAHIGRGCVRIRQGNFDDMSYPDDMFDKVCTANTIYFWQDPETTLRKIVRILKVKGKFVLGFYDKAKMEKMSLVSPEIFRCYSQADVKDLLTNAGFARVDILSQKGRQAVSYCAVAVK